MAADGSIILDTRINTSGFDALSRSVSGLPKALGKIGKAIGAAFAIGSITQFSKEAIKLGSDLQEVQNVVDVTFGNMNGEIEKFAQNAAEQFGLSELSAKQYTSTLGAMLKSMGFTAEQASSMSMELAGLAGDMASFYNLETDEAFYKLRSGISGETEPLKQLGINLSVANLEQYAFAQGVEKSYNAMTQQEQALLRYNYLLSVTSDAQGDFARTSSSWANQTRVLSLQFETLKATIGQGLINALTPVIQVINTILSGLQAVARAFQQFTALLFGNAVGSSSVSNQIQDIADGYGAAAGGAEDLAEGTKKAGQEAKRYLSSFDEITKLNDPDATSGGAGTGGTGGGAGGLGDFGGLTADGNIQDNISPKIEALVNKIKELIAPLQKIDFTPLKESLSKLGDSFRNLGSTVGDALEWAWYNILVPLAQWSIEELSPALVNLLAEAFDFLNAVLEYLEPAGKWLWEEFLQPLSQWGGDLIINEINGLADGLDRISNWISENEKAISNLLTLILSIVSAFGALSALSTIFDYVKAVAMLAPEVGLLAAMFPKLAAGIAGVGAWITGTLVPAVTGALASIGGALGLSIGWVAAIGVAVGAAVAVIVTHWSDLSTFITDTWNNIMSYIKDTFANGFIHGIATMIEDAVLMLWNFFVDFINSVIANWNQIWGSITRYQTTGTIGPQNYSVAPAIAAYSVTPEVPYLAKGAVLPANKPFLAMVGDQKNGTNIEAPLETIKQALSEVMAQQGWDVNVEFRGDLAALARILTPVITKEQRGASRARGG